jgi:membrane-associated phospholipid phosphatase
MKLLPVLLLCVAAGARSAETLSPGQQDVKDAGTVLKYAIPATALALTWIADPVSRRSTAEPSSWLLMGGSPRHDLLLAVGRAWMVTTALKHSIDATRPDGGRHSFPSGHTSLAFTGAEFIRNEYGWRWATPAYLAAGFVGWSRVHAKKHYTHDVVAGAVIGMLSNHDFWLHPDAGGTIRLSTALFGSGRAVAPGLRLEWAR